jgi:hypothetical protein
MNEKQQYYEGGPYPEGNLYTREILEMFFNILEQLDKSFGCDLSINFFVQKLRNLYIDEYPRILQKFNFSEDINKDSIFLEYMLGLFNYAYNVKLLKKNDVTDSRFFFTFDFSTNILVIPELNDTELVIFDNCVNKKPFLQIKINDTDFCLQAILIKSDDKFICITVEGRFEDKKVYYGRKYLDFFCENGFDIDPYELKPIQRYSSFFFYERLEKMIEFSERYLSNFSSLNINFRSLHKFWNRPIFPLFFIQPYNETRFSKFYKELDTLIPEYSFVFTLNGLDSLEYIDCLISEKQSKSTNVEEIFFLNMLKLKLLKLIREYLREDIMLYSEISGIFLDNVEYHNGELKTRTQFLVEESCIIDYTERNNFLIELLNTNNNLSKIKIVLEKIKQPKCRDFLILKFGKWVKSINYLYLINLPDLDIIRSMPIIEAGSEGDCLFHSLFAALTHLKVPNLPQNQTELRKTIVDFEKINLEKKILVTPTYIGSCAFALEKKNDKLHGISTSAKKIIKAQMGDNKGVTAEKFGRIVGAGTYHTTDKYFELMGVSGAYGEDLEIMTTAALYGVYITVRVGSARSSLQPEFINFSCESPEERKKKGLNPNIFGRIYLYNPDSQSHYKWICPDDFMIGTVKPVSVASTIKSLGTSSEIGITSKIETMSKIGTSSEIGIKLTIEDEDKEMNKNDWYKFFDKHKLGEVLVFLSIGKIKQKILAFKIKEENLKGYLEGNCGTFLQLLDKNYIENYFNIIFEEKILLKGGGTKKNLNKITDTYDTYNKYLKYKNKYLLLKMEK